MAVGYGHFEYGKRVGGLLCCWSLKNPEVSNEHCIAINNNITDTRVAAAAAAADVM